MNDCRLSINGKSLNLPADATLLMALREVLGLKGTRIGCNEGDCGACTVLVGGLPKQSCSITCADVAGNDVQTIESATGHNVVATVRECFLAQQAAQCGYCTNGIIMTVSGLLLTSDRAEIVTALDTHHICRCGAHLRILKAVDQALSAVEHVR